MITYWQSISHVTSHSITKISTCKLNYIKISLSFIKLSRLVPDKPENTLLRCWKVGSFSNLYVISDICHQICNFLEGCEIIIVISSYPSLIRGHRKPCIYNIAVALHFVDFIQQPIPIPRCIVYVPRHGIYLEGIHRKETRPKEVLAKQESSIYLRKYLLGIHIDKSKLNSSSLISKT